jgi:hypothetical protein
VSAYGSVDLLAFSDEDDASPYVDVAHDNGVEGGKVRLLIGEDFHHYSITVLSRPQAVDLARALLDAALKAEWPI